MLRLALFALFLALIPTAAPGYADGTVMTHAYALHRSADDAVLRMQFPSLADCEAQRTLVIGTADDGPWSGECSAIPP